MPLIVHWPRAGRRGAECDVPVISNDLYPTILEMADLPLRPHQHMDGVSLASLIRGDGTVDREAIYWHFPHYSNHGMQSPGGAIRFGDFKLIEYFENGTVQLFDLRHDIGEQNDLSQVMPEKVAQLRLMLHDWRQKVSAQSMRPNPEHTRKNDRMMPDSGEGICCLESTFSIGDPISLSAAACQRGSCRDLLFRSQGQELQYLGRR